MARFAPADRDVNGLETVILAGHDRQEVDDPDVPTGKQGTSPLLLSGLKYPTSPGTAGAAFEDQSSSSTRSGGRPITARSPEIASGRSIRIG